jgi:hypothetical protein
MEQGPVLLSTVVLLDRSHRTECNDSIQPLSRALIGGVQPKYGWWAPMAALYKEVGARAHDTRFAMLPVAPPISRSDLGLALATRSPPPPPLTPSPIPMATGSGSSSQGACICFSPSLTSLSLRNRQIVYRESATEICLG